MKLRREPQRATGDDGVAIVFFALALVAVLGVAALVLDGGQVYNQRRDGQNAADASSMAGTRALDRAKFNSSTGALPSSCADTAGHTVVFNTVTCVANQNGTTVLHCKFIDAALAVVGDCDTDSLQHDVRSLGVQVTTSSSKQTNFAKAAGGDGSTTAQVTAAALLRPIASGKAPWAICSTGPAGKYNFFSSPGVLNLGNLERADWFPLQGSQIYKDDPNCSAGGAGGAGSFKGKIDETAPMVVGQANLTPDVPGNGALKNAMYISCPGPDAKSDCMLLPIADATRGNGSNTVVYVKAWAYFHIDETGKMGDCDKFDKGNVKTCALYAGLYQAGDAPDGTGTGTGPPTATGARAVRLVK
jgi:hypothetical protein